MDYSKFDFLDFGASKAASLEFGKAHFFAKRGLGIDLDPTRVAAMNESGYDCVVGDLTDLKVPAGCVKFVKMAHILEHMPNLVGVEKALIAAKKAATDFLVITGPFFDEDEYLADLGFKLAWADYPEHTCHLKVSQLVKILNKLSIDNYELYLRGPVASSANEHVHPLKSPPGSHRYDPAIHPAKKKVNFKDGVWTDFVCYVNLRPTAKWDQITRAYKNQVPYMQKVDGRTFTVPAFALKKYAELDAEKTIGEDSLRELKIQMKSLKERYAELGRRLQAIETSRAWRASRLAQKTSLAARDPKLALAKLRQRGGAIIN